jgi:hypothetical protein
MTGPDGSSDMQAGWHPDPTGRHQHRYWDGSSWTDQAANDGQQLVDPLTSAKTEQRSDRQKAALKVFDPILEPGEELLSVCAFYTGPRAIRVMSEIPGFFIIPIIPALTLKYWLVGITQRQTVVFVRQVSKKGAFRVPVESVSLTDKGMAVTRPGLPKPADFWFQVGTMKNKTAIAAFREALTTAQASR